jgi:hypothetical protein
MYLLDLSLKTRNSQGMHLQKMEFIQGSVRFNIVVVEPKPDVMQ